MSLKVELLEQSFELVKPQADAFVGSFYNNLFTDYPDAKPLFEHSDMAKQGQMLKGALVMVVENLRKPDVLTKALKGLGARHVKYGALPVHYPLVGNSLLKTLSQYAGEAWTPELESAWAEAYGAITELMLEGADYTSEEVALESVAPADAPPAEEGGLQVKLLEDSFALVAPQADDLVSSFYDNLFTDYPAAKPLFEHTNMANQKQMLKGGLVMVVENLRKPEALSKALKGLGARHVKYGALPEHYPLVGNSLLKTLEQYAGSAWTPEVKDAWVGAYGAITELMLEGADYTAQEVALESAPPADAPPAEEGGLQVKLLEDSFALVAPQADDLVASFYNNLFTDYPAAKPLFEHSDMAKQGQMLKGALVMVVENLRKPEALSKALKGLGARHVKYGALPEHYPLVGNSLLKTLEQYAGSAWTPEVKDAWVGAYGAITELMLEGADYDKADVQLGNTASIAVPPESPEGVSGGAAMGVAGIGAVVLAILLFIFI